MYVCSSQDEDRLERGSFGCVASCPFNDIRPFEGDGQRRQSYSMQRRRSEALQIVILK